MVPNIPKMPLPNIPPLDVVDVDVDVDLDADLDVDFFPIYNIERKEKRKKKKGNRRFLVLIIWEAVYFQ